MSLTNPFDLESLDSYDQVQFIQKVALDVSTPPETLDMIAKTLDPELVSMVCFNSNTTPAILRWVFEQMSNNKSYFASLYFSLRVLASNPHTPVDILKELSSTEYDIDVWEHARRTLNTLGQSWK